MSIGFKVQTKIGKPIADVFQAVVKPEILNKYFTLAAQGEIKNGSSVFWNWTSHKEGLHVDIDEVIFNEKIKFSWMSSAGYKTNVVFQFKETEELRTLMTIEESGWTMDKNGIEASYDHCSGWEHMSTCLKAHMQYGIDLRN